MSSVASSLATVVATGHSWSPSPFVCLVFGLAFIIACFRTFIWLISSDR